MVGIYEVRHPELVLLGPRSLVLGLTVDPAQMVYDRSVDVDLFHIVRLDDIEASSKANSQRAVN
jgi:hypothetical protein